MLLLTWLHVANPELFPVALTILASVFRPGMVALTLPELRPGAARGAAVAPGTPGAPAAVQGIVPVDTILSTTVGQTVVPFREKKEQPFGHPLCR